MSRQYSQTKLGTLDYEPADTIDDLVLKVEHDLTTLQFPRVKSWIVWGNVASSLLQAAAAVSYAGVFLWTVPIAPRASRFQPKNIRVYDAIYPAMFCAVAMFWFAFAGLQIRRQLKWPRTLKTLIASRTELRHSWAGIFGPRNHVWPSSQVRDLKIRWTKGVFGTSPRTRLVITLDGARKWKFVLPKTTRARAEEIQTALLAALQLKPSQSPQS